MTGLVSRLMGVFCGIFLFQFNWNDGKGQGPWRLTKALGEFLIQKGLIVEDSTDSEDLPCVVIKRSVWAKEEGEFPMMRISGSGVIAIAADYTTVYLCGDGTCIVDRTQQEEYPDCGEGGYFATQAGTALGRVMGQGFFPSDYKPRVIDWASEMDTEDGGTCVIKTIGDLLESHESVDNTYPDEILITRTGHIEIPYTTDSGERGYFILPQS